jgi:hypothetical protein
MPGIAIATNQIAVIGPKNAATRAVPRDCAANSNTRIRIVNGTTSWSNAGVTIFNPSIADNTEIAGVISASPKNSDAPIIPRAATISAQRPPTRVASAIKAKVPPSPLLSARSSTTTYFKVTTMVSAHRIKEITPSTASGVAAAPPVAADTASRTA